jgi:hypothetical protein
VIDNVLNQEKKHLDGFQEQKGKNLGLIGYAKKCSDKNEDNESHANCLTRMINVLYDRSKAEVVFLSPCSRSNEPVSSQNNNAEKFTLSFFSCNDDT